MSEVIHVAVSPSRDYLPHCAVMLESLFCHNKYKKFKIHILWQEKNPESLINKLDGFIKRKGAECVVYKIEEEQLENFPSDSLWDRAVWLKLLIPKIVHANRVLYLDADVILRADISDIWSVDLQDSYIAAVQDVVRLGGLQAAHKNIHELGLGALTNYFNSGVMLMNLKAIRGAGLDEALLTYASDPHTQKSMADQDTMNVIFQGAWLHIPLKWNVMYQLLMYRRFDSPYNRTELNEALDAPKILHFCGPGKPWKPNCRHPFRPEYIHHLKSTPWASSGYDSYDLTGMVLYQLPLWLRRWVYLSLPRVRKIKHRIRGLLNKLF